MINFNFYIPTQVRFGQGCIFELPDNKFVLNKNCILVAYKEFKNQNFINVLRKKCKSLLVLGEFQENPTVDFIRKISNEVQKMRLDTIIAIGGGSSIDTAKAIAWFCANPEWSPEESNSNKSVDVKIIAVPTTAGTGSEVTPYSILTDHKGNKRILNHLSLAPSVTYCDPLLTISMPEVVTANSGIDALSHAIEAYLSIKCQGFMESFVLNNLKRVKKYLPQVIKNPEDINAREQMMLAAIEGGIVLAGCGTVIVHALGYCLTHKFDFSHGKANAILLSNFVNIVADKGIQRAKQIQEIFNYDLAGFIHACGISTKLPPNEIDDLLVDEWTEAGINSYGLANSIVPLMREDVRAILNRAL